MYVCMYMYTAYVCMYVHMYLWMYVCVYASDIPTLAVIISPKKFPVRRKTNRNPEVCRVCTFTDISTYTVHTYTDKHVYLLMYLPYSFRNRALSPPSIFISLWTVYINYLTQVEMHAERCHIRHRSRKNSKCNIIQTIQYCYSERRRKERFPSDYTNNESKRPWAWK